METQTVVLGKESYEVADPIMFFAYVNEGKTPAEAATLVNEVVEGFKKIMDGMCLALTYWPPHKLEYNHLCPGGGTMRMLLEKFPPPSP